MSDRWTISTYLNGNIVDIGGYLNWREEDMFYEAVAIMAVFVDCRTADDYWRLRRELAGEGSDNKIYRFDKRFMHELEQESEFPLLVDLTGRKIYSSFCLARNRDLRKIHEVGNPYESMDEFVNYSFRKGSYEWLYMTWARGKKNMDREIAYIRKRQLPLPITEEEITPLHVDEMINHYQISFSRRAIREVRLAFQDEPALKNHLSTKLSEMVSAFVVEKWGNL